MTMTTARPRRVYTHADPSLDGCRWIEVQIAEGLARRTVSEWRSTLVRFERDIGHDALNATSAELARWLGRDPERRSAITIGSDLSKLRAFYQWAHLTGLRLDDPTAHIRPPRRPRRSPRPITDAQFWRLDARARTNTDRAMVRLAGLAGLRVHEIARFRADHLDVEAGMLSVVGKGGHRCDVPAHPAIVEMARKMPRWDYWFPSPYARHLGGRTVSQRIRLHMIDCRVPGTPHCLRHYFGTELVSRGADLRVVQELMRHSMLSTTAIYVSVADTRKRAAIDSLQPPLLDS